MTTSGRLGHVRALDGVRGIAIALVLGIHSGYAPHFLGGGLGVDVFFVLSGFLITSLLLEEQGAAGRIQFGSFYRHRFGRLAPALLLMLIAAGALYRLLPGGTWHAFWVSALAVLLYYANVATALGVDGGRLDGMVHTWSLAMEEQFYFVWPALVALVHRRRWLLVLAVSGVALSWYSLAMYPGHPIGVIGVPQAYFRPDSRVGALLVGCSVALLRTMPVGQLLERPWVGALGAFGLALTVVAAGHGPVNYFRECIPAASIGTGMIVFGVVSHPSTVLARGLSWRPLTWLGMISYGVYVYSSLFNAVTEPATATWPIWLSSAFNTVAAILIAAASFYLLERPIRTWVRSRDRSSMQAVRTTTPAQTDPAQS